MISVITISCFYDEGLVRTLSSVDSQSFGDFEHIVVISKCDDKNILEGALNKNRTYILNQDNSIYNAMNIGLKMGRGDFVFFLNAGDTFVDEDSLQRCVSVMKDETCYLFRTNQIWGDDIYVRPPDGNLERLLKAPAHQGFFSPLDNRTPLFDESRVIDADTVWMKKCLDTYGAVVNNHIVANFYLGGVSNYPTIRTVWKRYHSQGVMGAFKELVKYCIRLSLGNKKYYKFLLDR